MAKSQLACIWCLKIGRKSREHIVAEVLGCPPGFVLKHGDVSAACNSRLAPLDAVLAQSFDFLRVWAGIPGKKHKSPRITGRTNVRGSITRKSHMELHFNMGSHAVDTKAFGRIPAVSDSQRDVRASFEVIGTVAQAKMKFTLGDHPHFSRAIHKIAFERLLKLTSWEHLLEKKFDPVRQYVMNGAGHREVLVLKPQEWRYYHDFPNSVWHDEEGSPSVEFILCGIPFVVGLGPDQRMIEKIKREAFRIYGPNGWAYLPVMVNASAP